MNILIADDSITNLNVLKNHLKKYGTVKTVLNGALLVSEFKKAFTNNVHYDLLCIDIEMPKMDGLTALLKIRELEEHFNLKRSIAFIITASVSIPSILTSFENQADAFIPKDKEMFSRIDQELSSLSE